MLISPVHWRIPSTTPIVVTCALVVHQQISFAIVGFGGRAKKQFLISCCVANNDSRSKAASDKSSDCVRRAARESHFRSVASTWGGQVKKSIFSDDPTRRQNKTANLAQQEKKRPSLKKKKHLMLHRFEDFSVFAIFEHSARGVRWARLFVCVCTWVWSESSTVKRKEKKFFPLAEYIFFLRRRRRRKILLFFFLCVDSLVEKFLCTCRVLETLCSLVICGLRFKGKEHFFPFSAVLAVTDTNRKNFLWIAKLSSARWHLNSEFFDHSLDALLFVGAAKLLGELLSRTAKKKRKERKISKAFGSGRRRLSVQISYFKCGKRERERKRERDTVRPWCEWCDEKRKKRKHKKGNVKIFRWQKKKK